MADISFELEALSSDFAEKVGQARDEVVEGLYVAMEDMTPEERMIFLGEIEVATIMTGKLTNAMGIYEEGIRRSLESTFTTATLPESSLQTLLNQARNRISTEVTGRLSNEMMDQIVNGMATNKFPSEIIGEIDSALSPKQLETLINTTYNQFNNAITNQLAEMLPKNTKFIYIGPFDAKTRDECVERIKMGPSTRAQILKSKFGNFNNAIWNCRHKWEEMDEEDPAGQGYNEDMETIDA